MSAPEAITPASNESRRSGVAATARGGWWGAAGSIINAVSAFLFVGLVTRSVGARGAGSIFAGVALFTILSNACKLGADTGLVRFVSRDIALNGGRSVRALVRTAVVPTAVTSTAIGASLLLFPEVATHLLPQLSAREAVALIRVFAIVLPAATVSLILLGVSQGYGTVVPFVGVEQVGKPVLRILIAVPLAYMAPGMFALATAWLLPALVGPMAAWFALQRCRARHLAKPSLALHASLDSGVPWRTFWAYAAPRAVSSIFDISAVWVGVLLLSALASATDAGIYTAIGRVVTAGALVQLAVALAVGPQVSRMLALDEIAEARHLHRVSTCWVVLFSGPLFALLAIFPRSVLSIFGADFTSGAPALVMLCLASMFNVAVGNAQSVLLMAGKSSWHLAITAAAFSVQFFLGIIVVPTWGIFGAALSWGAAIVLENLCAAFAILRSLGFTIVNRSYARAGSICLAVSVVMGGVHILAGDTPTGLAIGLMVGMATFVPLVWRYRAPLAVNVLLGVLRRRTT
ncbi:oligosaccharide flippase family protein [Streptomyces sp. NPDC048362]|uniref:oligosaccharide flippase family protein n=1 Tax=Streptomyces sp. NPDC048362 TaxID=3365539 RepID=UPI003712A011